MKPLTALSATAASAYLVQVRLGWLNACAKEWTQSIACYGKASKLVPFAIEPLLGMMLAQQYANKNDDALHTAQVVLRQDPNNYTAISRTAWLLFQKRDFKQASFMYRKLVNLYPSGSNDAFVERLLYIQKSHGLDIVIPNLDAGHPLTNVVNSLDGLMQAIGEIGYPVMVKGSFYKAYKCHNATESVSHYHDLVAEWG